jgi:uncharacterized SAM-binding protein YcdF (DUF218 family)
MRKSGSADENTAAPGRRRRSGFRIALWVVVLLLVVTAGWCWWVYGQIEYYAGTDQAQPSGAIAVFGAAEYDGRPSPVYRARLDHAKSLYGRRIAPLIITLGGPGGDAYSEGEVGRQYLLGAGVPESDLIAETQSTSSSESARRLAVIARVNHLQRLVVVSDDIHMFRLHAICAADGLDVLTSPRPRIVTEDKSRDSDTIFHEILTYTLWKLHLD